MGALHEGHRSLIRHAHRMCDIVIVSLFINPLQFGPSEDLNRYPSQPHADQRLCRQEGVTAMFLPSHEEVYPTGFQTSVTVSHLTSRWEGECRPTHFRGVATVVTKLLNVVQPNVIFFGQKDYQQTLVITQLVKDLNLDVKVIMCPTRRESDGLAYSSRNQLLSSGLRKKAPLLYQALMTGEKAIHSGERSSVRILTLMKRTLLNTPPISIDYLAICRSKNLEPVTYIEDKIVMLGAIRLGKVRLIDNLLVRVPHTR